MGECCRLYEPQLSLSFFTFLSLSEHNQRKVEPMSTATSADGTIIDYDAYGEGPTVILIGGATQHRAIDQRTTEIAKQLAAESFTAVDYDRRGRDRSGDTPPWSLAREVEDIAALIEATGAPAALYTSSSGATIALAAVTEGLDVSALALYEPPYFAGSDRTEQITTLERMLNAGQLEEATRYNLTALIGLPATAVEEIAQAPWWPGLVAVAPTLVYDHKASHDIETDPDWRTRWAAVTVPTVVYSGDQTFPECPRPPTPSQPHCLAPSGACSLAKTTGRRLRRSCLSWLGSCGRSPRDCQGECSASHNGRSASRGHRGWRGVRVYAASKKASSSRIARLYAARTAGVSVACASSSASSWSARMPNPGSAYAVTHEP